MTRIIKTRHKGDSTEREKKDIEEKEKRAGKELRAGISFYPRRCSYIEEEAQLYIRYNRLYRGKGDDDTRGERERSAGRKRGRVFVRAPNAQQMRAAAAAAAAARAYVSTCVLKIYTCVCIGIHACVYVGKSARRSLARLICDREKKRVHEHRTESSIVGFIL